MRQGKSEQLAKWRVLVSDQIGSGQTVAAFCGDRGVRDSQFYDWKKRLRDAEAAEFVQLEIAAVSEPTSPRASRAIEVRVGQGRSLFVEPGFDARHLRALLGVLEAER
jgi:transposase-like protein